MTHAQPNRPEMLGDTMPRNLRAIKWSPKYALKVARILLQYPSILPAGLRGRGSLLSELDERLLDEYMNNPLQMKRINDFVICLNPIDRDVSPRIAAFGWIEGGTTELFLDLLERESIVLDIGANIGWYTLLAASKSGRESRVISFEPNPASYSLLSKSVALNHFENIELLPICVSNTDGLVNLNLSSSDHEGHHSIKKSFDGRSITVECCTLDLITSKLGIDHIDIMKIDVE